MAPMKRTPAGKNPPSQRTLQLTAYVLIGLGVVLYVLFGLLRGAILDAGTWALLIVPVTAGVGALMVARAVGASSGN